MKKILSLILAVALITSVCTVFSLNTAAANNMLTITCRGKVIGQVEVGNQFIYHVAMNSSGNTVSVGEAQLRYDDRYVKIVEYGEKTSTGKINMNGYSFPSRIRNSNLVTNFFGQKNVALYNFSKYSGVGSFTDSDHFFKVRMKALAPGTVEIRYYAKCFYSGLSKQLIYDDVGNEKINPVPHTVSSIEPSLGCVGDADHNGEFNVLDATYVQRITAGSDLNYTMLGADSNSDGTVDLLDALNILRCYSGLKTQGNVGQWLYESEK